MAQPLTLQRGDLDKRASHPAFPSPDAHSAGEAAAGARVPASRGGAGARAARGPVHAAPRPARTSQRLSATLRLLVARRAQIGVVPAAEAVLQVPGALAVPDQH